MPGWPEELPLEPLLETATAHGSRCCGSGISSVNLASPSPSRKCRFGREAALCMGSGCGRDTARAMSRENLEIDHVLIAVADLADAAREIEARYGLASVEGGRHPGWGTANRIVPLGETYLELIAVIDEAEAAQSPFGSWVARAHPAPARPLGWAVRTPRIDDVARRLGLVVSASSRATENGQLLRWRVAGIEQVAADPSLPILVEWGHGTPHPGQALISHPAGPMKITRLWLDGDADRLDAWLGTHDLPIAVRPGRPALTKILLAGATQEIVLEAGGLSE